MSRFVIFVCVVMLATAVLSADPPSPPGVKGPPVELPKGPDVPKTDLPKTPDAKGFQDITGKS